jgi:putative ABC transport system ATP-binding protein
VSAPFLELRGATKRYPAARGGEVVALDRVDLAVEPGSFVAVAGPSGGGKTTLLGLLALLDRPTEGRVLLEGRDLAGLSEAERSRMRRRLGVVFQATPSIRGLPVWENVAYPLVPLGVTGRDRRARAAAVLDRVGIGGLLDQRPEDLSGGELQRMGIARALVGDPRALVADEPTSNLDPASAAAVVAILRAVHARGATVVVATHAPEILGAATVVHALEGGRLRNASGDAATPLGDAARP